MTAPMPVVSSTMLCAWIVIAPFRRGSALAETPLYTARVYVYVSPPLTLQLFCTLLAMVGALKVAETPMTPPDLRVANAMPAVASEALTSTARTMNRLLFIWNAPPDPGMKVNRPLCNRRQHRCNGRVTVR